MNNGCIVPYSPVDTYFDAAPTDTCTLETDGTKVSKETCSYEIWIFATSTMVHVEAEIVAEVSCRGVPDHATKLPDSDEPNPTA